MQIKRKSLFGKILSAFIPFRSDGAAPAAQKENVEKIHSQKVEVYSQQKQEKLKNLCEKLFEQKELITTGKLQLIGLSQVKKTLGKKWPGLQLIVYEITEESISKYLMPKDIFIRYKDDTYVVIFAEAGEGEAQIKATLIAEEIRRRLLESDDEEVRKIEVEESVAVVATSSLKPVESVSKTVGDVTRQITEKNVQVQSARLAAEKKQEKTDKADNSEKFEKEKQPVQIPQAVEVNPSEDKLKIEIKDQKPEGVGDIDKKYKSLIFNYMPLWDVKKNLLTVYLCLVREAGNTDDPMDAHEVAFRGTSPSEKSAMDLAILTTVSKELQAMEDEGRKLFIACPVHYDTLCSAEGLEKYLLACQKIPPLQKRYLTFLLLGLPATIYEAKISKFTGPLKLHCSSFYAQVPLDTSVDFGLLRENRFDAVGVRLKKVKGSEKQLIQRLNNFTEKAKSRLIQKTFVLDVGSLSITTSAVCADYDFLAGSVIHDSVEKPDNVYRFKYESLFDDLIKEQQ